MVFDFSASEVVCTVIENCQAIFVENLVYRYCDFIKSITITKGLKTLSQSAFQHCAALESVVCEEDCQLDEFSRYTFANCKSLKTVVVPASVKLIEDNVFFNSPSLESVRFEDTVGWKKVIDKSTVKTISVDDPTENAALIKTFDENDGFKKY